MLWAEINTMGITIGAYELHVPGRWLPFSFARKSSPANSSDAIVLILGPAMNCPQIQPASDPARQATEPNIIVLPISAPNSAAAASGPGVGGTIACVSCNEPTRPIDMTPIGTFMSFAAECTSGFRMT